MRFVKTDKGFDNIILCVDVKVNIDHAVRDILAVIIDLGRVQFYHRMIIFQNDLMTGKGHCEPTGQDIDGIFGRILRANVGGHLRAVINTPLDGISPVISSRPQFHKKLQCGDFDAIVVERGAVPVAARLKDHLVHMVLLMPSSETEPHRAPPPNDPPNE